MRLRLALLSTALAPFTVLSPALAVDITEDQTAQLRTSTVASGNPGDITITEGTSVETTDEDGVVVDSDNSVINAGTIRVTGDNLAGIRVLNGITGGVASSGLIEFVSDYEPTDEDGDGDFDGVYAQGTNRVGILIEGPDPFTGNVQTDGTINISANESAGLRSAAQIVGNVSLDSGFNIIGSNNAAVDLQNGVDGDVRVNSRIEVRGENSVGASLRGDVTGALGIGGQITVSGFRETSRRRTEELRARLDADDLLDGGPAVAIGGSVAGGILIDGPTGDQTDVATAGILSIGSAPAVLISSGWDSARTTDLVVGLVDGSSSGFVNRGSIRGAGVNDGYETTALQIGGGTSATRITGGVDNSGEIIAQSFLAEARALHLAANADVPRLNNSGTITASMTTNGGDATVAVDVDATATLGELINSGILSAVVIEGNGDAYAVRDQGGMLTLVENLSILSAAIVEGSGRAVAIDANHGAATTVRQYTNGDNENPTLRGDILLGGGDDAVLLEAGSMQGDIDFGAGNDRLELSNGATLTGSVLDSDGNLALIVSNGTLALSNAALLNLDTLTAGDDAEIRLAIDGTGETLNATRLNVSGTASIASGALIAPSLVGLPADSADIELISAGTLVSDGNLSDQLSDNTPFLYNASLRISDTDPNTVILSLQRRSAGELGMGANQASAYEAVFSAIRSDTDLSSGVASATTADEFFTAYNQFLPDYSGATLQFAVANLDSSIGAVANRLDVVRAQREVTRGFWVQEFTTFQDLEGNDGNQGFRGHGIGFAAGFDRAFGPFYAAGLSASIATNNIEQAGGFDEPMSASTIHFGSYAAAAMGNVLFDAYLGGGFDFYESERELQFADISRISEGSWNGHHLTGSARLAYELTGGRWFARPALSVDYLMLRESDHQEKGGGAGVDLYIAEREATLGAATTSLTLGAFFGDRERFWWSPRVKLGYRNEFSADPMETEARFVGIDEFFLLQAQELPDAGLIGGLSLTAGGEYTSFSLDYDADVRDAYMRHVLRVAFRLLF